MTKNFVSLCTMNSKLLVCSAIIAVTILLQNSSVDSLDLAVRTLGNVITNQRVASRIPYETKKYTTTTCCGGVLTQAPGEIKQHFKLDEASHVKCTWKIHAPAGQLIFIRSFMTSITTLPGKSLGDQTDDLIDLQIYEGYSTKPLFNSKIDSSLDNCITNDTTLRVVLNYAESGLYAEHEISIKYGFAEDSDVSDLFD